MDAARHEERSVKSSTLTATILAAIVMLALGLTLASRMRAPMEEASDCRPAEHARVRIGAAEYRIPTSLEPRLHGLVNERAYVQKEPRDPKSGSFISRYRYCAREEAPQAAWANIESSGRPAFAIALRGRPDSAALQSLHYLSLTALPPTDLGMPQSGELHRRRHSDWRQLVTTDLDANYRCRRSIVPDDSFITCNVYIVLDQGSVLLRSVIAPATGDEFELTEAALALDRLVAEWRVGN